MDHQLEAVRLYRLTKDPWVLDAVRVLDNPDDPLRPVAVAMIERMAEARTTLFPPIPAVTGEHP